MNDGQIVEVNLRTIARLGVMALDVGNWLVRLAMVMTCCTGHRPRCAGMISYASVDGA